MLEGLIARFATAGLTERCLAKINALPVRWDRHPVRLGGFTMTGHRADRYLAMLLWKAGVLEAGEIALLKSLCRPGMIAVDVGANIGYHALTMGKAVAPGGEVWAFEPDPDNFASLRSNLERNAMADVHPVSAAVGDRQGRVDLWVSPSHGGDHRVYRPAAPRSRQPIQVDLIALDQFFSGRPPPQLIKMDIQGAEPLAIRGMSRLLRECSPLTLLFEIWVKGWKEAGEEPLPVLQELSDRGFRLELLGTGRAERREPLAAPALAEVAAEEGHVSVLASKEQGKPA